MVFQTTDKAFFVSILTPEKAVFSGKILSLTAPGQEGYLGILVNHAPLLTALRKGRLSLKKESGETVTWESLGGGFLEVSRNKITLLLDKVAEEGLVGSTN